MASLVDQHGRPLPPVKSQQSFYRGTHRGRYRGPLTNQVGDSKSTLNSYARSTLLGYARTLVENFGEVKGLINDLTLYSVGAGIKPQSLAVENAEEYESFFSEWAKLADLSGQNTFWELQKMASKRMDVDGDIGFNMVTGANNWPFLEPVEGHRIMSKRPSDNESDGVAYSLKTGKPVAYSVKAGDRFKRIPARNFILVHSPDRVNQYRGKTSLAHAIHDIWDSSEILEFEKLGIKAREAIGFIVTTQSGDNTSGDELIDGVDAKAASTGDLDWESIKPGLIPRFSPGEGIQDLSTNRPSSAFQGFLEMLVRKTALGLGLPYEFAYDPTKAGGAQQRAVLAKAQRTFSERASLLDQRLNNRVWGWVISKGIARGDLKPSTDWWKVRWQHPKKSPSTLAGRPSKPGKTLSLD